MNQIALRAKEQVCWIYLDLIFFVKGGYIIIPGLYCFTILFGFIKLNGNTNKILIKKGTYFFLRKYFGGHFAARHAPGGININKYVFVFPLCLLLYLRPGKRFFKFNSLGCISF